MTTGRFWVGQDGILPAGGWHPPCRGLAWPSTDGVQPTFPRGKRICLSAHWPLHGANPCQHRRQVISNLGGQLPRIFFSEDAARRGSWNARVIRALDLLGLFQRRPRSRGPVQTWRRWPAAACRPNYAASACAAKPILAHSSRPKVWGCGCTLRNRAAFRYARTWHAAEGMYRPTSHPRERQEEPARSSSFQGYGARCAPGRGRESAIPRGIPIHRARQAGVGPLVLDRAGRMSASRWRTTFFRVRFSSALGPLKAR